MTSNQSINQSINQEIQQLSFNKTGIIIVNLGTPEDKTAKGVKDFLNEFLMDKNVIELPWLLRFILVRMIIVPLRYKNVLGDYDYSWDNETGNSLLLQHTIDLKNKIFQGDNNYDVDFAFRYGKKNNISKKVDEMVARGVKNIKILPLFPQYAMSTYYSVVEQCEIIREKYKSQNSLINLRILAPFFNDIKYHEILANKIESQLQGKNPDMILFSYHGLPQAHVKKDCDVCKKNKCEYIDTDDLLENYDDDKFKKCYLHQSYMITAKVAKILKLKNSEFMTTFQSRLGPLPWLQPYTSDTIENLAKKGIKNIAIVGPSFIADCIETKFELGMEVKEEFMEAGGKEYTLIECMNSCDEFAKWIEHYCKIAKEW